MTGTRKPNSSHDEPHKPLKDQPMSEAEKIEKARQEKLLEERLKKFRETGGIHTE
jgi:hypothetical protein